MKRDGRKLDHKTLEEIRRMAVQRVWDGEKPSVVIASYGFSRQIIYKWLREALLPLVRIRIFLAARVMSEHPAAQG
jgi:hypothetical protein